jgi:hypothetical protein
MRNGIGALSGWSGQSGGVIQKADTSRVAGVNYGPLAGNTKFYVTRGVVALFVLGAVATFYRVVHTTTMDGTSLYALEFALMLLYICWVGLVRPLREH